jgi:hypothetical protein
MERRGLLARASAGMMFLMTGCLSSVPSIADSPTQPPSATEHWKDRKLPDRHLGVFTLEPSERPKYPETFIDFLALLPPEQIIVKAAIEQGRYAICLPQAPEDRVEAFTSLVARITNYTPKVTTAAYLKPEDTYYQFMHVPTRGQVSVTAHV